MQNLLDIVNKEVRKQFYSLMFCSSSPCVRRLLEPSCLPPETGARFEGAPLSEGTGGFSPECRRFWGDRYREKQLD